MNRPPKISGSIYLVQRQRGEVWYAKWREPDPLRLGYLRSRKRLIGPVATSRGQSKNGYYTQDMAQAVLDAILTDVRRGITEGQYSFGDACKEFIRHHEEDRQRTANVRTIAEYEGVIYKHLIPTVGASTPISTVTVALVERTKKELLATNLSRRSVQKIMVILFGILKHAKNQSWIEYNPAEDSRKIEIPTDHYRKPTAARANTLETRSHKLQNSINKNLEELAHDAALALLPYHRAMNELLAARDIVYMAVSDIHTQTSGRVALEISSADGITARVRLQVQTSHNGRREFNIGSSQYIEDKTQNGRQLKSGLKHTLEETLPYCLAQPPAHLQQEVGVMVDAGLVVHLERAITYLGGKT